MLTRLFKKVPRNESYSEDQAYSPRVSTYADAPRPFNNAKPMLVDTMPVVPDASDKHDSFYYREGRAPAHQYSRVTTPLNFNPTYGGLFVTRLFPGGKIPAEAQLAMPRNRNRGMAPIPGRVNQYRPDARSYGTQSQMGPGTVSEPSAAMSKWFG